MQFSLPFDDGWSEGKLVLENEILYFCNKQSKSSFTSFLKKGIGKKTDFFVPLRSIIDVIREKSNSMTIKHTGNADLPTQELVESQSDLHLSTYLSADEQVLNDVEHELILGLDAYKFNVYFMHAGKGGVHSMEKNAAIEKGLLKIANEALWMIGRKSHKRIAWRDIVNVELKKRSEYKGIEYGAISIDHFGTDGANNEVISSIVITKGSTIDTLKQHALKLLEAYKMDVSLSDAENQLLAMMYAGVLELSPSALAPTAEALGLREKELEHQLEHLTELGIIDRATRTLSRKGVKYAIFLLKEST